MASEHKRRIDPKHLPSVEAIRQELGKAESIDDFFGKEGIFARLFADTLEHMLEAELTEQVGYERYEARGRNSGNSRNGKREKRLRTQTGDVTVRVPRDRNSEYQSPLLAQHAANNELEEKIITHLTQTGVQDVIDGVPQKQPGAPVSRAWT